MDRTSLADLRARRDALDEEIRTAEANARADWNSALDDCETAFSDWLASRSIEATSRERKNVVIVDVGNGALTAMFVRDDAQYGPGALRVVSGREQTVTLEWNHVPESGRLLAIVAALLNEA